MTETKRSLVTLPVSPWSERAKWALDHHGLAYETIEHVPFLGERRLRRLVGPSAGRVTVPVLLDGEQKLTESWEIALYADREGERTPLLPFERQGEIRAWNDLADRSMEAGRALVSAALLASPEALDETLPRDVPGFLRPLLRPVTRYGTAWFARKYELDLGARERHLGVLRATLERLRSALAQSSPHLLGSFSYADIVMAVLLQGVSPVDAAYIPLGPASRRAWTRSELAPEFSDLIAWRDELYSKHRARASRTALHRPAA
jgi:glutathione S-transferase